MLIKRKLFSKKGEKKKETAVAIGTGAGIAIGANKVARKGADHFVDKLMDSKITASDVEDIKKKLIKGAKKQGIKVVEDKEASNAAYTGSKTGRKFRNGIAKLVKTVKKSQGSSKAREFVDQINTNIEANMPSKKMWKNLGKDAIVVGKEGALSGADVVSHEIGHAQYMKKGRSKSVVGKAAHKLMTPSKLATSKAGSAAFAVHGFKSGVKSERLKQEGKKESTWNKVKSVALPAAAVAPLLIAEGKASANGIRNMKKLGASKKLLKESKRNLANAWGSYASCAAAPIVSGEVGRLAGKGYGKLTKKDKDNK